MKNEWLTIDGKQVLWDEFAYILDDYRSRIKRQYGSIIYNRFIYMISPIQEMADIYHNRPEDWPADYVLEELEKQEFPKLKNNELPDAIGEAFDQMVKILGIDPEAMLSICIEKSQISYQKKLKAEEKENDRQAKAHALAEKVREKGNDSEITFLVELQKAKEKSSDYETTVKEWQTTELLCQILVCKLYTEVVPYDILDKSNDLDLIDSEEIRNLLKENGYEFDYKCYRDDFIGDYLTSPTIIHWKEFIEICGTNAERILGCKINI